MYNFTERSSIPLTAVCDDGVDTVPPLLRPPITPYDRQGCSRYARSSENPTVPREGYTAQLAPRALRRSSDAAIPRGRSMRGNGAATSKNANDKNEKNEKKTEKKTEKNDTRTSVYASFDFNEADIPLAAPYAPPTCGIYPGVVPGTVNNLLVTEHVLTEGRSTLPGRLVLRIYLFIYFIFFYIVDLLFVGMTLLIPLL